MNVRACKIRSLEERERRIPIKQEYNATLLIRRQCFTWTFASLHTKANKHFSYDIFRCLLVLISSRRHCSSDIKVVVNPLPLHTNLYRLYILVLRCQYVQWPHRDLWQRYPMGCCNQKVAAALVPVEVKLAVWAESMVFRHTLSRTYQ